MVLDVDGVLTDGNLFLGSDGHEYKSMHVRDGLGIKLLMQGGIEVVVISGRPSPAVEQRLTSLGVNHFWLGVEDKIAVFDAALEHLGVSDVQCAVMGDDVPDLPLMARAGLALTVADAHPRALANAHWASRLPGGRGAVREAADWILSTQRAHR
jgi:3-deoxy-D-manno-octulosonate 8-phosphate phosphatase (KDO 8-P phosphatase)